MNINLNPIGFVESPIKELSQMPILGVTSKIIIKEEFKDGLLNIQKNSHLWIISWFHLSNRDSLILKPKRIDPNSDDFGVFSLRAPVRPNPIALTLVKLISVEKNTLTVSGLDAINGTPVLDIKPYSEKDSIFSPETPYIRPADFEERKKLFKQIAINFNEKDCEDLEAAVEIALYAEEKLGILSNENIEVQVKGSQCFANSLQALTRAKIGDIKRFTFEESKNFIVTWKKEEMCFSLNYDKNTKKIVIFQNIND